LTRDRFPSKFLCSQIWLLCTCGTSSTSQDDFPKRDIYNKNVEALVNIPRKPWDGVADNKIDSQSTLLCEVKPV